MYLTIKIDLNNAAFEGDPIPEVRRILSRWCDRAGNPEVEPPPSIYALLDRNGNGVGVARITP